MSTIPVGNKLVLLSALGVALAMDESAKAAAKSERILLDDIQDKEKDSKHFKFDDVSCMPRTKTEKLAAVGLSVNTAEVAKAERFNFGIRPPNNALNPESKECKRRLKQMQRRRAIVVDSPEVK